jgi:MFS family permease
MNTKYILLLVVLASTMGQTATDIYIPSLPNLAKIFDSSSDLIKTTVTIVYFGYAIMQFICGPLSDRLGRKYFMVMGIGIFATSTLMASYCETVTDLLMIRLIQGIGIGSFGIANRAILFDTFHGNEYVRAISIVGITMTCASLITPAIGACIFDYFGWRANFNIMFVYAIILLTAVLLFLPETHKPQQSLNYAENNSESKTGIFSYFVNNYKIIFCSSHFWT